MALLSLFMDQLPNYSKDDILFAFILFTPFLLYLIIDLILWCLNESSVSR